MDDRGPVDGSHKQSHSTIHDGINNIVQLMHKISTDELCQHLSEYRDMKLLLLCFKNITLCLTHNNSTHSAVQVLGLIFFK
jgi:hypothetical protein